MIVSILVIREVKMWVYNMDECLIGIVMKCVISLFFIFVKSCMEV